MSSIMNVRHVENYVFRNYEYPVGQSSRYPGSFKYSLIQGVRASSAAPAYYKDYLLDENLHIVSQVKHIFVLFFRNNISIVLICLHAKINKAFFKYGKNVW